MLSGPVLGSGDGLGSGAALNRSNSVFLLGAWFLLSKRVNFTFLLDTYKEKNSKSHLGLPTLRWEDP